MTRERRTHSWAKTPWAISCPSPRNIRIAVTPREISLPFSSDFWFRVSPVMHWHAIRESRVWCTWLCLLMLAGSTNCNFDVKSQGSVSPNHVCMPSTTLAHTLRMSPMLSAASALQGKHCALELASRCSCVAMWLKARIEWLSPACVRRQFDPCPRCM